VGGVAQPQEGLDVQLLDTLAGEAQGGADGGEGLGGLPAQAVVGDHDLAEAEG